MLFLSYSGFRRVMPAFLQWLILADAKLMTAGPDGLRPRAVRRSRGAAASVYGLLLLTVAYTIAWLRMNRSVGKLDRSLNSRWCAQHPDPAQVC